MRNKSNSQNVMFWLFLYKSYDKEDFKISLLEAWKDLYCDYTNAFLFREYIYKAQIS